jgi:hypothetical protein
VRNENGWRGNKKSARVGRGRKESKGRGIGSRANAKKESAPNASDWREKEKSVIGVRPKSDAETTIRKARIGHRFGNSS